MLNMFYRTFFPLLPVNPSFYMNICACCAATAEEHREKLLHGNSAHCEVLLRWGHSHCFLSCDYRVKLIIQFKYASVWQLVLLNHNPSEIKFGVHL